MAFRDLRRGVLEVFAEATARQPERAHAWAARVEDQRERRRAWMKANRWRYRYPHDPARRRAKYLAALEKERARNRAYAKARYHEVLKHDPAYVEASRRRAREAHARKRTTPRADGRGR